MKHDGEKFVNCGCFPLFSVSFNPNHTQSKSEQKASSNFCLFMSLKSTFFISLFTSTKLFIKVFVAALSLTTFCVNCRPETDTSTTNATINIEDTDDEFVIKKPSNKDDPKYVEFVDELYHHDEAKKQHPKTKRDSLPTQVAEAAAKNDHEKLTVELPNEFDIPAKPSVSKDGQYDEFLTHLYRHDELKLKRSRRMIVFRHDYLKTM